MILLNRCQSRSLTLIAMLLVAVTMHSQVLVQPAAPTPALAKLLADSGPCAYAPIDLNNPGIAGKPFQNPPDLVLPPGGEKAKLDVVLTDRTKEIGRASCRERV